ncbi:hypothetical protein ACFLQN_04880 [Candidatus Aenigmatarchaeota archaeon]
MSSAADDQDRGNPVFRINYDYEVKEMKLNEKMIEKITGDAIWFANRPSIVALRGYVVSKNDLRCSA